MEWNDLSIPKLQRCNCWSLGMDKSFHPTLYCACDYLCMLGFKLINVSNRHMRKQICSILTWWLYEYLVSVHCNMQSWTDGGQTVTERTKTLRVTLVSTRWKYAVSKIDSVGLVSNTDTCTGPPVSKTIIIMEDSESISSHMVYIMKKKN